MVTTRIFCALLLAGLGGCVHAPAPAPSSGFRLVSCAELGFEADQLDSGVDCGWLSVPEDRSKGAGRSVKIAVLRARALNAPAAEPILYLHGGPGIATLDLIPRALAGKSWPLLRNNRDLIFFDQRGTGRSTPVLCPEFNAFMDTLSAQKLTPEEEADQSLAAARACRAVLSSADTDPSVYGSTAIADDADALRQALGYESWNVFATSFGTLPAAELIRRHPGTVRAVLMDSAFPPNSPNRAEQVSATAESFAAIQRRCDDAPPCREAYGDLRAAAGEVAASLDTNPVETAGGVIDGEAFLGAVWTAQVWGDTVGFLPQLFQRAGSGDAAVIETFVSAFGDSDVFGGYSHDQAWLVNCRDIFLRPSAPAITLAMRANPDLAGDMPAEFTDRMCAALQPEGPSAEFSAPLQTQVPVLVLFGEFDPATPRSDALAMMQGLEAGHLVEIAGASHGPFYTDACTRSIAVAFFDAPERTPDISCLNERPPFAFADAAAFKAFLGELAE